MAVRQFWQQVDPNTGALAHDVVRRPLVVRDGAVVVPEGPGLGVELDEDAVRSMRVEI